MKSAVLDASAVITFFGNRPGAEAVQDLIALAMAGKRRLLMSVLNWGEVFYSAWRAGGELEARRMAAEIAQLPIDVLDIDRETAELAATLHVRHNLPYMDCFVAALADSAGGTVITADRDFALVSKRVDVIFL